MLGTYTQSQLVGWRSAIRTLLALAFFHPALGDAQDTFGLGDGHSGSLYVLSGQSFVQSGAYPLSRNVVRGDRLLQVPHTAAIPPGSLVMLIQMTGLSRPSGDRTPIEFTDQTVGLWELGRVTTSQNGILELTVGTRHGYGGPHSQLVLVPEYTHVTIEANATLSAEPWNGVTGGILAFLAQGHVQNDGEIHIRGRGFRGGMSSPGPNPIVVCGPDFDLPAPRGANKGEGISSNRAARTGRGNVANAGGGGNCHASGGGGGGNFGEGGKGGFSVNPVADVGGLGGAALNFVARTRLFMGGGGGSGQGIFAVNTNSGAAGGGVILFRAAALTGNGILSADGATADGATGPYGAGGGGAGGTIYVRLVGAARCRSMQANGGTGGSNAWPGQAPGGGGGGGVVFLQGSAIADCHVEALGGSAGTQPDISDDTHGATPKQDVGFEAPYTGNLEIFEEPFDPDAGLPSPDAGVDVGNSPSDGGQLSNCESNCDPLKRYRVGWGCNSAGATSSAALIAALLVATSILRRNRAR